MAEPERLHETLDAAPADRWVVIYEVQRVPAILDAVHQRMDREPERRFLLTGSSARSLHRAGVNLLGGRAGRRIMSPFLAAELGTAFSLAVAQRIGLLPVIWTANSPEQALADYATVAVFDEVRAEARVRQIDGFARTLEPLALSHGSVISPTAIAQLAAVKKGTVAPWRPNRSSTSPTPVLRRPFGQPSTRGPRPTPSARLARGSFISTWRHGARPHAMRVSPRGARPAASRWTS